MKAQVTELRCQTQDSMTFLLSDRDSESDRCVRNWVLKHRPRRPIRNQTAYKTPCIHGLSRTPGRREQPRSPAHTRARNSHHRPETLQCSSPEPVAHHSARQSTRLCTCTNNCCGHPHTSRESRREHSRSRPLTLRTSPLASRWCSRTRNWTRRPHTSRRSGMSYALRSSRCLLRMWRPCTRKHKNS